MQPKKGDARNGAEMDSEAKWIRLSKQLFLDLAYMSLVSGLKGLMREDTAGFGTARTPEFNRNPLKQHRLKGGP